MWAITLLWVTYLSSLEVFRWLFILSGNLKMDGMGPSPYGWSAS